MTAPDDLAVLPRVWDELWAEHGPAIVAAQNAVVEAHAAVDAAMGAWA